MNELQQWLADVRRAIFMGTVGPILRWTLRLVKRTIFTFVACSVVVAACEIGLVFVNQHSTPDAVGWIVIGATAISVATIVTGIVIVVAVLASLLKLVRHPLGGPRTPGGGQNSGKLLLDQRPLDNVRQFPEAHGDRRRAS